MAGFLSGRTSLTTVQTADLAANAITTAKILDGAVTAGKLASGVGGASTSDMRLAFLMIAENAGDRLSMDDGIADPFKDETDIDTSTSTNETYDAAGDYYSSPSSSSTITEAADWTDTNGTFTFGTGAIDLANGDAIKSVDTFTGDFSFTYTVNGLSPGRAISIGAYAISEDATFTPSTRYGGMNAMTDSVHYFYSNVSGATASAYKGSSAPESGGASIYTLASGGGTVVKLERVGSAFKAYSDGVLRYTWTHTSTAEYRLAMGTGMTTSHSVLAAATIVNVTAVTNMTLVSNAFTATAVPATGRIHIQVNPVDSITINTDLTAEISRDSGTTWTAATLALTETLKDGTLAYEDNSVTISGQPSGTAMKYRIKTLNTKEVQIHGAVLQWST
jgi:hypothetical protein